MVDQIHEPVTRVRARAPVRIDFAGGWTDVPAYAERDGGRVVNAAVSLYTHVDCTLGGKRIRLVSRDLEQTVIIPDPTGIMYNGELDLHKAALNMLPVSGGIELVSRSDVPAGSGLGGSGSLDVSLLATLARAREEAAYDAEDFAEMGFLLETSELRMAGGRQDQYGAAFGGFNEFVFGEGPVERIPIQLSAEQADELRAFVHVIYTGESRFSPKTHDAVWAAFASGEPRITDALHRLKGAAVDAGHALRQGDWGALAAAVDENWSGQKQLSVDISTPTIEAMEQQLRAAGILGMKAAGAGAGGCLIVMASPDVEPAVRAAAEDHGGELLAWTWDLDGVRVWS